MRHKFKEEWLNGQVEKNDQNFVAIIIDVSSVLVDRRIVYHSPDEDFKTFEDFVEGVVGEFSAEKIKLDSPNFTEIFLENMVVEGKDFDEDSGREWATFAVEGVLIHCFNGFEWAKLDEKIASAGKAFTENENAILENYHEGQAEIKDPYGYRGLSKRDFL